MAAPPAAPGPAARKPLASWRRPFAAAVPYLLLLFLLGLLLQVYFAGYGLLGGDIGYHLGFAHVVEALPLLVILAGFLGGDKGAGIIGIVLLVQFQLQYVFIYALDDATVRALHPANGFVMALVTGWALERRWPWAKAAKARVA